MPSDSVLAEACNTIRELKDNYIRILEDSILDKIEQIEKNKEELKAVKEELKLMNDKLKGMRIPVVNKETNHACNS